MGGKMAKNCHYDDKHDYNRCCDNSSVISQNYCNEYRSMFDDYPVRNSTTTNRSSRGEDQKLKFTENTHLLDGLHPQRSNMPNTNPYLPVAFLTSNDSAVNCNRKRSNRF
ncbi:hypothetical protein Tcan_12978 [Toxocara canis]|uniref:Uncharacterized protein n=1 Tax=Toxocara canis TaxID=6265 RepID=A0A0B2UMX6_TOXCA|nr:hypothetical protein Tcan_12978 [Toxocara canis]